jgi:hypothetical protein
MTMAPWQEFLLGWNFQPGDKITLYHPGNEAQWEDAALWVFQLLASKGAAGVKVVFEPLNYVSEQLLEPLLDSREVFDFEART